MYTHFRLDALTAGFAAAFVMAASMGVFTTMATEVDAALTLGRARSILSAPRSFEQGTVRTSPSQRGITKPGPTRHP